MEADRWLLESKWGSLENKCIHCLSGWFLNSCCATYCITLVVGIELCVNAQWKHPKHCVNTWWQWYVNAQWKHPKHCMNTWWQWYVNAQWKHPNTMWTHGDIGMWMQWKHPKCYVNTWWKWYVNAQWKHPKHYVNTWWQWYVNTQWKHPNAMWTCGDNGMWMHSENTLTQCEHMVTMVCSAQWKHPKHWTHGENGMWMHSENTLTLCEHSHGDCIMKTWNICDDNEQMLYTQWTHGECSTAWWMHLEHMVNIWWLYKYMVNGQWTQCERMYKQRVTSK